MENVLEKENTKKLPEPNAKQKECIYNTKLGKYLVLAGPGTGKTFTVTRKIKHMIENEGVEPQKILCLTFSNTAAREMKTKIGENYDVNVFTYHEFCLNIMEEFPEQFDNENSNQKPSKLIDYAMSKRPILSFNSQTFKAEVFEEFLRGDYTNQEQIDLAQYDIRTVVDKFEELFS